MVHQREQLRIAYRPAVAAQTPHRPRSMYSVVNVDDIINKNPALKESMPLHFEPTIFQQPYCGQGHCDVIARETTDDRRQKPIVCPTRKGGKQEG